ncbi:hypothetical protein [Maribacter antarcticus]|uniref:hypothetical protein n=1 Tax=Maribacter antarcticus TaxID=505250 RepID=UPI000B014643|nr:hypothetical protein [Maribacter antarcticus]
MRQLTLLLVFTMLIGCNDSTKKEATTTSILSQEASTAPIVKKETKNNNILCQINGRDWAYTKASGIVSMEGKPRKRTAIITFTKKLEKGSETIQLYYDADSFELIIASLQLKFKNKDGKLFTCYYYLSPDTQKHSPKSIMSGTVDLSNLTAASGTAVVSNINIKYEKEALLNPEEGVVTLTDLEFTAIGYSDIDKLSNAFKK